VPRKTRQKLPESTYYPAVQDFLIALGYTCESKNRLKQPIHFITRGIGQIVMDVFGIRSAPSQYSAEFEVAAVEVKRSTTRASLRYMNQAVNNSRLAHFCYLAMPRKYSEKEKAVAADLGIGLLRIPLSGKVLLVSQSRRFSPNEAILREFFRKNLAIGQCSICSTFVSLYGLPPEQKQREGGGWRHNAFSRHSKWVYFCPQCRERFENIFSERRMRRLEMRLKRLEQKQKNLSKRLKSI
jgi:hypothetical protein